IFMPSTAQALKIKQTQKQLGSQGKVIITGDCFDDALMEAQKYAEMEQASFIAPFDDVLIMAGQGTVGLEIMQACPNPGTVYLQIGGGGMAAGVACALKHFNPEIRLVGVEAESQASMRAAFDAGCPVELGCVDPFCDGTAVRKVGNMTFAVCKELLDDLITVTNQEVRNAMQFLWNEMRIIPEPSGALGLAALLQQSDAADIKNAVTILSGANMDFSRLSMLAS
ncbi:MAG TPA: pyridoxal-phosphate dependent enzyme, partial [Gemmatales bacterium]|nr:pyridoxal-phosphate dependent enzyme [Gemmatales bacterium]